MDPRNEPLSPLFCNKPGVKEKASRPPVAFLFRRGGTLVSSLYNGYEGSERLAEEIRLMREQGLAVAVWDNCPAGTTKRLHELLNRHYPGLFPGSVRFLSTRTELQLGDPDFFNVLCAGLKCSPDDLLVVTANPGQRDHALRTGMASYLVAPEDASLVSALPFIWASRGPSATRSPTSPP
jgi:hypothetical protein